ncbi:Reverse transcriptase [Phytophthora palmivora]|uniref:Reverse transcriptase n=1 Tax=Phytophthora palmivora TaxID=4796 RepID=A0A2P4YKV9_9STRA|nr:Reverse transcriptase [Phytophthora palmivora]
MVGIFGGDALRSLAAATPAEQGLQTPVAEIKPAQPKPLRLKLNPYDGKEGENFHFWVREVELAMDAALISTERLRVAFALSNLGDLGVHTREAITPGCFTTWAQLCQQLRAAFLPANYEYRQRSRFLACKQGKRELHEYIQEMRVLTASLVVNPLPENIKVTVFMDGPKVGPSRTQLFRVHANIMEEAIQIALQEEYSHRQATMRRQAQCKELQQLELAPRRYPWNWVRPYRDPSVATDVGSLGRCNVPTLWEGKGSSIPNLGSRGPVAEAVTQEPGELGSPVGAGRPTGKNLSPPGKSADGARHGGLAPESLGSLETRKSSGGLLARRQHGVVPRPCLGQKHEPWIDWRGKIIGAIRPTVSNRALVSNVPTSVRDWGARDGRQSAYVPEEVLGVIDSNEGVAMSLATGRETKAHCQACGIATTASSNAESRRAVWASTVAVPDGTDQVGNIGPQAAETAEESAKGVSCVGPQAAEAAGEGAESTSGVGNIVPREVEETEKMNESATCVSSVGSIVPRGVKKTSTRAEVSLNTSRVDNEIPHSESETPPAQPVEEQCHVFDSVSGRQVKAGAVHLDSLPEMSALLNLEELSMKDFLAASMAGAIAEMVLLKPETSPEDLNSSSVMDKGVMEGFTKQRATRLGSEILKNPEDPRVLLVGTHPTSENSIVLWEWLVIPQGLSNAPATFNRLVTQLFRPLRTFAQTRAEGGQTAMEVHLKHLRRVFEVMRANKLYANIDKCDFAAEEKKPSAALSARSAYALIQGSAGYAELARPLSDLLKKDADWVWEQQHQDAFEIIKASLQQAPVLALPDENKSFSVVCDASDYTIGCALLQKGDDEGHERVISFQSRQLKAAERNYPVHDKELVAMKYALVKFRVHLLGTRPFVIYTDHASLRTATNSPHLSQRMARWLSFFAEYNFRVEYKPGKLNVLADALSR